MVRRFKQLIRDSKAVSALEYAILVGVIAVAIGLALTQPQTGDRKHWG